MQATGSVKRRRVTVPTSALNYWFRSKPRGQLAMPVHTRSLDTIRRQENGTHPFLAHESLAREAALQLGRTDISNRFRSLA
jgi:hypothetical protein